MDRAWCHPKSTIYYPKLLESESALWRRGYRKVAGIDEAGRGCLAGPVVAAAVILPRGLTILGVDDSKKLSAHQREAVSALIEAQAVAIGVGVCSPAEIDQLNILWAAMEAMRRAAAYAATPRRASGVRLGTERRLSHPCALCRPRRARPDGAPPPLFSAGG